jgi:TonB family protein
MRIPSKLIQHRLRTTGVFVVAMLTVQISATAIAQDMAGVTHFIDRNTDRIPSLTIFPKYPSIARRDRIEGEVTVCFKIKANGNISRPVVTERSHRIFSKPSLRAIRKSNYEPIGPRQLLATARTCRIYRFRLEPVLAEAETPAKN